MSFFIRLRKYALAVWLVAAACSRMWASSAADSLIVILSDNVVISISKKIWRRSSLHLYLKILSDSLSYFARVSKIFLLFVGAEATPIPQSESKK